MKNRNALTVLYTFIFFLCSTSLFAIIYPTETSVVKYLKPVEITEYTSGIQGIDCIYVINLDERPERMLALKPTLEKNNLKFNRFSAINGWLFSQEEKKDLAGLYPTRVSGGRIGCLLSHVSILKDADERDFDIIWILEDDIEILEDVNQISDLLKELSAIDPDWDIFYTDTDHRDKNNGYVYSLASDFRVDRLNDPLSHYIHRTQVSPNLVKLGQRFGTHSMIYSRKGIKKVLHYFTHVYLWTAIDIDLHYIPGINEYCPVKDIVSNLREGYPSDIFINHFQ